MKTYLMSSIIFLVTFSQLPAIVLVQEDFNSPVFPPPVWSVEKQGDGNGNWFQEEQQGRICAWGYYYHVSGPSTSVQTSLVSKPFTLNANESCTITFLRWNHIYNSAWGDFKIKLRRDGITVWERSLSEVGGFTFTGVTTETQMISSSNYQVVWFLEGSGWDNSGGAMNFYVDDIAIYSNLIASSYESLGRIKADFK